MADAVPDADKNVPPVGTESHNDSHNVTEVTETPPPGHTGNEGHGSDNSRIERLENAFTTLTETMGEVVTKLNSLVDANPIDDERPVKVPWTHRGKW